MLSSITLIARALAALPHRTRLRLGRSIGWLLARLLRKRRWIIECNLARAFPEHDDAWRKAMTDANFARLGEGALEAIWGWYGDTDHPPHYSINGAEHLDAVLARGQGAILCAGHFTDTEFGVYFVSRHWPIHAVYRPNDDPALDELINRGRLRHVASLIDRESTMTMARTLKQGKILWTAPDQSYHGNASAFLPFFGTRCATNTAVPSLARLGKAAVLPYSVRRHGAERYEVVIQPPLANFPSGDDDADTRRLVQYLEEEIRLAPETYLWGHRRYKDLAPDEPPVYVHPASAARKQDATN